MGQFNTILSNPRVMFDEEGDNGLCRLQDSDELPVSMQTLEDADELCLAQENEQTLAKPFPWNDKMPSSVFYLTCTKKPYERNLLRNHSGAEGLYHWEVRSNGGDHWTIEEPPIGVPELPQTEPMFKDRQICFTTSYQPCFKKQDINLTKEGIHPYILDTYQPPIVVSEWYSCRWDCPAKYQLNIKLIGVNEEQMDYFYFQDTLVDEKQNQWLQISHVFKNYGTGLRIISFEHGGMDRLLWAGHYGSKMAGACVSVKVPENICTCTASVNKCN